MTKNLNKKNNALPRSHLGRNVRFAFFGTPELATVVLDELEHAGYLPALVVTTPDKARARGMEVMSPPTKLWAKQRKIPVLQPEEFDSNVLENLRMNSWDVFIVIYYGKVLPRAVLDIPHKGTLNIHFSLLPRWRGTSPVRAAILNDDREIGTSIILLDEKIDHGPVVAQKRIALPEWPPRARETETLATRESAKLLISIIPSWLAGDVQAHGQNHDLATHCPKITKADGLLNLADDAYKNLLKIRAFDSTVGTYAFFERPSARSGQATKKIRVGIIDAHVDGGKLIIDRVKPEGKKEMRYEEFLRSGALPISGDAI